MSLACRPGFTRMTLSAPATGSICYMYKPSFLPIEYKASLDLLKHTHFHENLSSHFQVLRLAIHLATNQILTADWKRLGVFFSILYW